MISDQSYKYVLKHVRLITGETADVLIDDGLIAAIEPGSGPAYRDPDIRRQQVRVIDAEGYMLLPGPVEPHAHLDKALIAARVPNPTEDLPGAIEAIISAYPTMTADDVAARSRRALIEAVRSGYTAVRSHADCRVGIGNSSIEALAGVKAEVQEFLDLQIVALAGLVTDPEAGAQDRRILEESIGLGADLIGGVPSLEPDPSGSVATLLDIAEEAGVGVDLHVDETLDPSMDMLRVLAEEVLHRGFDFPVTASHCVSLGMQDPRTVAATSGLVAEAGINVVTLPQTNLYLQGRGHDRAKPRGLTAVRALMDAGVNVVGGSDNWRDPFNPMGRIDPMETAALLITAGHLLIEEAYMAVSNRGRRAMGLPEVAIIPGAPADLLCIRGSSLADAIARGAEDRMVFRRGRLVAHSAVEHLVPLEIAR